MKLERKKAGFWIRFASLIIDISIFVIIGMFASIMCIDKVFFNEINSSIYQVKTDETYYIWMTTLIILIFAQFAALPAINDGRTTGMLFVGLCVDYQKSSKVQVMRKKIEVGPMLWIVLIILFMIFVNPLMINKMIIYSYVKTHSSRYSGEMIKSAQMLLKENKMTLLETVFYTIPSTLSPILLLGNIFILLSCAFRKSKRSLVDRFTESQVVYIHKYIETKENVIQNIEPELNKTNNIIWRN